MERQMRERGDAHTTANETCDSDATAQAETLGAAGSDFSSFFSDQQERLVRAMYLLTGDRLEAEDLSQEALVRVYERWGEVAQMDSPAGYLYRTALNLHRRRVRRLLRHASMVLTGGAEAGTDPEAVATSRSDVARALHSLTRGQREVIILHEWLDLTSDDLATVLRISPSAARVRLHRARQCLRDQLGGEYG
jgi:RNA polymerase sigma factor (sigma-70 family)